MLQDACRLHYLVVQNLHMWYNTSAAPVAAMFCLQFAAAALHLPWQPLTATAGAPAVLTQHMAQSAQQPVLLTPLVTATLLSALALTHGTLHPAVETAL
jgi:hypothetical protein